MYENFVNEGRLQSEPEDANTRETYRRVTRRLFPFFLICYTLAYLDRVNIGFAQLQMQRDLGFSAAVYGLGAGVFFIGYVLLEVPSNLMLRKIGARKTFTRIMVLWGLISAAMMFVRTPVQFYVLRFLLGMAEAGFFPGMVLYFTYWFPRRRRAAMINVATLGSCVAGVGGGIVSGAVMRYLDGIGGLSGWQWMFLVEGTPTVLMGVIAWFFLVDRPGSARWLSDPQKVIIAADLRVSGEDTTALHSRREMILALRRPGLYVLSLIYFCLNTGIYTLGFWIPTIIRGFGVADVFRIGLYTTIPYAFGAVAMFYMTRSSDRREERRWHFAVSMTMGALALALLTVSTKSFVVSMLLVTVSFPLIFGSLPIFWAAASAWLGEEVQAAGLAFVSSLGSIGAFVSPAVLGWIKTETGSLNYGFYLVALTMVFASALMLVMISPRRSIKPMRPVSQKAV
ncbi:nitrate/nitrite transporter [Burkholderia sp. Ch1-1]|nr:nitrate/nitrite transporter [Burkholderia sp. Ch1-1]